MFRLVLIILFLVALVAGCARSDQERQGYSFPLPLTILFDDLDDKLDHADLAHIDLHLEYLMSMTISGDKVSLHNPSPNISGLTDLTINGETIIAASSRIVETTAPGNPVYSLLEVSLELGGETMLSRVSVVTQPHVNDEGRHKYKSNIIIIDD